MRQWHQGKEGFMKVTRIQDKYNPDTTPSTMRGCPLRMYAMGHENR